MSKDHVQISLFVEGDSSCCLRANGTHEVFVRIWCKLNPRGVDVRYSVEESRAGADWWGWVADAPSYALALAIAIAHVEPGGEITVFEEYAVAETEEYSDSVEAAQ